MLRFLQQKCRILYVYDKNDLFRVFLQKSALLKVSSLLQRRLCREQNLKFGPKSASEVTYFGNKF